MGHHELLEALRREGELKATSISTAAEAEALRLREAASVRMNGLRSADERRQENLRAARRREILAEAERGVRRVRLAAEHGLALRLRELARTHLAGLRTDRYEALFRDLVDELPDETWGTVRVHPLDAALAGSMFPSATIEIDDGISGGFEAATADGSFTVVNTLAARLERVWPDILPEMVAELRMGAI